MKKSLKKAVAVLLCLVMFLTCMGPSALLSVGSFIAQAVDTAITAGDINGDGNVNNKDLTRLLRYIAGDSVEVVRQTLDTNGDGNVNNKDLTRLLRYIAGEDVEIHPKTVHDLTMVDAVPSTCVVQGHLAYWQCGICEKIYTDAEAVNEVTAEEIKLPLADHTIVVDEAVAPTTTSTGLTEGSHCGVCGKIIVPQLLIPIIVVENTYSITYKPSYNDDYLSQIDFNSQIPDEVRTYTSEEGLYELPILEADGYNFVGWFNGSSSMATMVNEIPEGSKGNKTLYARWEAIDYTITFDSPFISVNKITDHNINKATALPGADTMNLYGYKWLGWSDDNGELYDSYYPAGKKGHVTLHANWQSYRNQAVPNKNIGEPKVYIDEEAKTYMFTFDLGQIKNVPLYTVNDFGKMIPGQPVTRTEVTTSQKISEATAQELAETVSKATTKTATWTLSNEWNKISTVSETHASEMGIDVSKIDYDFSSETTEMSLTRDMGESTNQTVNWGVNAKIYGKNTLETEASAEFPVKCVNVGVGVKNTTEVGGELSGHYENTTVNDSYWNTSEAYDNSLTLTSSETTSQSLSKHVSDTYGYSTTNSIGGSQSNSEEYEVNNTETQEYASSVAYATEEIKTTTYITEYTTEIEGWWRQIVVGNMNVIGVVAYDMETSTYSVYTYSVLDDKTTTYMDFSRTSGDYDDFETGVIPFEIPVSVNEIISTSLGYTTDLDIDRETGIVSKYKGDAEHIHVPDYMTVSNGDGTYSAIKVNGIAPGAFENSTGITSVRLGKYITEIPTNAFAGCSNLKTVEFENITKIGAGAFANCTSLEKFTVSNAVTDLGANAFTAVPEVVVYASKVDIVKAAVDSKIKNLSIYLNGLKDELINTTLVVSDATESFALYGRDADKNVRYYTNVSIESDAATTVINGMKFGDNANVPLKLNSEKVTLAQVSVEEAKGVAMILGADVANLSLMDKNYMSTQGSSAILAKGLVITKDPSANTTTYLSAENGNLLYCGDFTDTASLFNGTKEKISEESYKQMVNDSLPWVLASDAPADATIVSRKWTYDLKTEITSDKNYVDGYTLYNTTSAYGDYGSWSSWSKTYAASSSTRQVETKTVTDKAGYTNYRYWIYRSNDHRTFGTKGYAGICYNYAEINLSYALSLVDSANGLYGNHSNGCHSWCTKWFFGESKWVPAVTHTEYRYRDRQLVYTYYHFKLEPCESNTIITESNTQLNVQEWVQYVTK